MRRHPGSGWSHRDEKLHLDKKFTPGQMNDLQAKEKVKEKQNKKCGNIE